MPVDDAKQRNLKAADSCVVASTTNLKKKSRHRDFGSDGVAAAVVRDGDRLDGRGRLVA